MPGSFNPNKDIPSLADRVILITGGTGGLGAGSIKELSKHSPAHILFTGRNQQKADALIADVKKNDPQVKTTFIPCDIASLASVQSAARQILQATSRLDILMLNAGIMAVDAATSQEGYEIQFATNYLGHTLLVKLLLPLLTSTADQNPNADVRVINMTSIAYKQAPRSGIDFATLRTSQKSLGLAPRWARYGQSKLAQMLYSQQLARRHPRITSVSVHPGFIMTGLFDGINLMTKLPVLILSLGKKTPVEQGHYAQCWAATVTQDRLVNGEYYEPIGRLGKRATAQAKDMELAERLWNWTENELRAYV